MEFKEISTGVFALPVLFKKTSSGALQFWEVRVSDGECGSSILTRHGQFDTSSPQETTDLVTSGKNQGKKNETSIPQQARLEAISKWEHKLKDGYVQSREDAEQGKVDAIIEGGIEPMLAHVYDDHSKKIRWPCFVQPKLDGIRCIAIKKGNEVTLWSRSRKRITSCPHIEKQILEKFHGLDITLDGELYNHELKHDFEKIISAVRVEEPSEDSLLAQYHIYDVVLADDFHARTAVIKQLLNQETEYLKPVTTYLVENEDIMKLHSKNFKAMGYEGAIARNFYGKYEFKRSYNLQKVKEFDDAEFEIVGVQEGKGKLRGNVGAFVCKIGDKTFEAKPTGNQDSWKPFLTNETLWKGKKLVVQYQGLTGKNKVPRFPVGLRLRDAIEG